MKRLALGLMMVGLAHAAPAPLTVTISKIVEDVSVRQGNGAWQDAQTGQAVVEGHELNTGPESEVTLAFSDGTAVVVRELSQLKVNTLLGREDRVKMELLLRIGDLKAQVKPQTAVRTDFSIGTPSGTASVRGTEVNSVSYYPPVGMKTDLLNGKLLVELARGTTQSNAGDESHVTPAGEVVSPAEVTQSSARVHVEPVGLTETEKDQIEFSNQPQVAVPSGSQGATNATGVTGGTLILRVNRN